MILDETSRAILDFEAAWVTAHGLEHTGRKDEAIRAQLSLTPVRFYVLLSRLLDDAGANAYQPELLAVLRRRRDAQTPHPNR